jgi:hypothetical protein
MATRKGTGKNTADSSDDDEIKRLLLKPTITVPQAGMKIFGLSRNGSYEAAKRGDFETIRMGKLLIVPTAPLRRKLGIEA